MMDSTLALSKRWYYNAGRYITCGSFCSYGEEYLRRQKCRRENFCVSAGYYGQGSSCAVIIGMMLGRRSCDVVHDRGASSQLKSTDDGDSDERSLWLLAKWVSRDITRQ